MIDFVLASTSPRRLELLRGLGWSFQVIPPEADETPQEGEGPEDLVTRLALAKALSVLPRARGRPVLGSDTVVALEGQVLGKPRDDQEAFLMLRSLSGRSHQVFTGVALAAEGRAKSACDVAHVTFRSLTEEEIRAYVATGEGKDKAGSYALQGKGGLLVQSLSGHSSTVIGLSLPLVSDLFAWAGVCLEEQWRKNGSCCNGN